MTDLKEPHEITLHPLKAQDFLVVAHLRVAPDQLKFSGTVAEAFEAAEQGVDFHAISEAGRAVGFFKIDRLYATRFPFVPPGDLGLRAFLVDHARQGGGIATRAVRALPAYLRMHHADARALWLTVNKVNPGAIAAYTRGGFVDTGQEWPHGDAGPQHIMRLMLRSEL